MQAKAHSEHAISEAPRALRPLYGYGDRPQEILTPQAVLDMLPWPVALDPCACPGSLVKAEFEYRGPTWDPGGLVLPWRDRTYVNPPYKDLKVWLARALDQRHVGQMIMLAPVRTHRAWFREAMTTCQVVWLNPVTFVGYEQAFPAPLCLLCWGFE